MGKFLNPESYHSEQYLKILILFFGILSGKYYMLSAGKKILLPQKMRNLIFWIHTKLSSN